MTRLEYLQDSQKKLDHAIACERKYFDLPGWRFLARRRAFKAWTNALDAAILAVDTHDALWPGH
jgi:hypothetical protein